MRTSLLIWSALCIGLGVWVMSTRMNDAPPNALTCRPSDPVRATADDPRPVILMFGNSLIFDHNWRLAGVQVVNCARQGLTLSAALPMIDQLPDLKPKHVLLSFGSVELLRAARSDTPLNVEDFSADIATLRDALQARWPQTHQIWLTLPALPNSPAPDFIDPLNMALAAQSGIDTNIHLDLRTASYDGTHLREAAYLSIERALMAYLAK